MKNGYDHRYKAGRLRDTIVDLLKRLRRRIQTREIEANKDNVYVTLDQEFNLYKVKRSNLKIYCTQKAEAPKAIFRRPPKEFLVDDFGFEIGFKTPYNGEIDNFEDFALGKAESVPTINVKSIKLNDNEEQDEDDEWLELEVAEKE